MIYIHIILEAVPFHLENASSRIVALSYVVAARSTDSQLSSCGGLHRKVIDKPLRLEIAHCLDI